MAFTELILFTLLICISHKVASLIVFETNAGFYIVFPLVFWLLVGVLSLFRKVCLRIQRKGVR